MVEEIKKSIEKPPWRSSKFIIHVLTLVALTWLSYVAMERNTDPFLFATIAGFIAGLGLGSVGTISWMDKNVRVEGVRAAAASMAPAPPKVEP